MEKPTVFISYKRDKSDIVNKLEVKNWRTSRNKKRYKRNWGMGKHNYIYEEYKNTRFCDSCYF